MTGPRSKLVGYALFSWPPHAMGYVVVPVAIARRGQRRGWRHGRPGVLNLAGVPFVAAGAGLIAWAIRSHYRASPDRLQATARPDYLVTTGAYEVTRNPLYVGGAALWLGWAALFGSRRVVAVGSVLFGLIGTVGVRFEERMLRDRFGAEYDAYCARVPRWLVVVGGEDLVPAVR